MKKLSIACVIVFVSVFLNAQDISPESLEYPWHLLEQGKIAYEERDFGEALLLFRQACEMHKTLVTAQYDYLLPRSNPIKYELPEILFLMYRVLENRQDYAACTILDGIFLIHPPAYFDKSISTLLVWLKKSDVYPECDYLIGKVYELEGELSEARRFYQAAWEAREFLYIPDMRFEIIYSLAQISGLLKQYDDQENISFLF